MAALTIVMAGLVPAIHVFLNVHQEFKTWMPAPKRAFTPVFDGLCAGMTGRGIDAR